MINYQSSQEKGSHPFIAAFDRFMVKVLKGDDHEKVEKRDSRARF
ncbi:MAG: hypothetical protein FD147_378 [Chloroflexi bacterium]|nr:MAG: hypothetical protein FD147_378 [Chloroflexota bacterium]